MNNLQRIALLIDADNAPVSKLEAIVNEISTHGRIVVKRAFGNWRKDGLKSWIPELGRLAINAVQQFDYVKGKNATDMALVINAMDLLSTGDYDGYVIVASDSDYTPLALRLQESGAFVFGVGEKKTPEAFRNACDEFIIVENLEEDVAEDEPAEGVSDTEKKRLDGLSQIHALLRKGYRTYQADDGFTDVSAVGQYLKRAKPDFDSRTYGYAKLSDLIGAFPKKYRMERVSLGNGNTKMVFKVK